MPDAVWGTGSAQAVPNWPEKTWIGDPLPGTGYQTLEYRVPAIPQQPVWSMPAPVYAIEAVIDGHKVRIEAPSHEEAVRLWNALAK